MLQLSRCFVIQISKTVVMPLHYGSIQQNMYYDTDHIRYPAPDDVAPVEQCCLCPVGHIRVVACGAVLPMPSGAALQMYILNVTQ